MRTSVFCLATAALVGLGVCNQGFCMADRPPASKKSTSKQVEPIRKIFGKFSGYNRTNSTITIVSTGGVSIIVEIDKSTRISKSGKMIKMADVKMGDMIIVDYETKGGKKMAEAIIVQEKAASQVVIPDKRKR